MILTSGVWMHYDTNIIIALKSNFNTIYNIEK